MKAKELESQLINYTASISQFDTKRDYISMSNIHLDAEELVKQFKEGYRATLHQKLKCYKGYQMEHDLKYRISNILCERHNIQMHVEYKTEDNLFKCHPDLGIDEIPTDCKSVLKDEWLPDSYNKVSRKIKYQMQGQMLLGKQNRAMLIYESRESGLIKCIDVEPVAWMQDEILIKMDAVRGLLGYDRATI